MKKIYCFFICVLLATVSRAQIVTYDDIFLNTDQRIVERRYSLGDTTIQSRIGLNETIRFNVIILSYDKTKMMFLDMSMGDLLTTGINSGKIEYSELQKMITSIEELLKNPTEPEGADNTTTWLMTRKGICLRQIISVANTKDSFNPNLVKYGIQQTGGVKITKETYWDMLFKNGNNTSISFKDINPLLTKFKEAIKLMEALK